jgi:hypothetical protein
MEAPVEPLAEDELPEWLQELRARKPALPDEEEPSLLIADTDERTGEVETALPVEAPVPSGEGDEIPDWLEQLGAEQPDVPDEELVSPEDTAVPHLEVTEELPAAPLTDEELPDWLQELRAAEPVLPAEEEGEPVEWMAEDETMPITEAPAEPAADEELPDWLQEFRGVEPPLAEEEQVPISPVEAPAEPLADEELPDWLQALRPGQLVTDTDAALAAEEATPGQPEEAQAEPALIAPVEMPPLAEDAPAWLAELEADIAGPAEVSITPTIETAAVEEPIVPPSPMREMPPQVEGMPAWLTALEAEISGSPAAPVEAPEPVSAAEELQEPELPEAPAEVVEVLPEPELAEPPPEAVETLPEPELAEALVEEAEEPGEPVPTEAPAWLAELEAEPEKVEWIGEVEAEEALPPEEEAVGWLEELRVESLAAIAEEAPSEVDQEPTPVGKELVSTDDQVIPPEPTPAELPEVPVGAAPTEEVEAQPEWLRALEAEPVTELTVEEMPDWLDQLHAVEDMEADVMEQDVPFPEEPIDEQELAWLRELSEMEAPEPIEAEGEMRSLRAAIEAHLPVDKDAEAEAPLPDVLTKAEEEVEVAPQQKLTLARSYLEQGSLDSAAEEYLRLLTAPSVGDDVVQDLEQAVEAYPDHPMLHRVLGDAYVRAGLLQEALRAYRSALSKL